MKIMTAAQAVQLIESGDSIYIQGSTSIPEVLSQALADRGHELKDVTVYAAFAVGRCEAPYCKPEYKDAFNVKSLFVANNVRKWLAQGYGSTIPAFLGEIPGLFRDGTLPLDAVFLNVSPPNEDGYCSYGISADLAVSATECARKKIVQINKAMPFSYGDALIHVSEIDAAVEVDDAKRHEYYDEIQEIIHEAAIFVPLCSEPYGVAIRSNIDGFVQTPLGNYRFNNLVKSAS